MRTRSNAFDLLGLTREERRILRALPKDKATNVSELSRRLDLPRTTTRDLLHKLSRRGLARKVTHKAAHGWKCPSASAIERRLIAVAEALHPHTTASQTQRLLHQKLVVSEPLVAEVVRGVRPIIDIYIQAYSGHEGERVYLTQFAHGFRALRKKIPLTELKKGNALGAQHGGILDMLMTPNTKKEYARLAHEDEKWPRSAQQRMASVSLVPEDFFPDQASELFIFRDMVMLTDWEAETAVVIHNKALSKMLRQFFEIAKMHGETFDNSRFLQILTENVARFKARASGTHIT